VCRSASTETRASGNAPTTAAVGAVSRSRHGYTGRAQSDTHAQGSLWGEWFVIVSDHTIWPAWPGSGGWRQIPNDGRAVDSAKLSSTSPPSWA